ncbi:porin family protein [Anatilimnocola sp. NA78]|uniref:porin family protein n=1 Tax=Anatilimnocola sp. NA78 TaxID=3415683 RepID=UPI003CE5323E
MLFSGRSTKCAITLAVLGLCALASPVASGQTFRSPTPARKVGGAAPTNPLRSEVIQAQATEALPSPLRDGSPSDPLGPSGEPQLVPVPPPGERSLIQQNTAPGWPADAPAYEHYGPPPGHHGHGQPRAPWFEHGDPNDVARHTGWGEPLTGTSWRNRPWYWGVFIGGILNDELDSGRVEQDNAPLLGIRLGNDFDHFWGWEGRYAFSRNETFNGITGAPIDEPSRNYYMDVSVLHYPWGDSRWRPYISAGLGFANFRYENERGQFIDDTALTMPIGVGLKHFYSPWFSVRFDIVDNFSIGTTHVDAMHSFSLMAGVEFRFGGDRPNYFPWHGNTTFW